VKIRTAKTLEWVTNERWLLDIALDNLSIGRALVLEALKDGTGDFNGAADFLDRAVDGLRRAGTQHYIPLGLLSRADLHRLQGDFARARRDLDEAWTIATRGEMALHQVDCHLGYARLFLAQGMTGEARKNLDAARAMIQKTGYHRRDRDLEEIENSL
jgi:tetratricopeptide (TPR) repeat protein